MQELAHTRSLALRLAVLALLAASALAAQEPAEAPQRGEVATEAGPGRAQASLVQLTDGTVLRVRARRNGDQWELESSAGWRALPESSLASVRSEREVLAQARDLTRAAGRKDANKRVALADWMLRAGLAKEALAELDGVFAMDSENAAALALLAAPPQPLRVGQLALDDPAELLKRAAGAPASVRELAFLRLAELEQAPALQARLARGLRSSSPRMRALSAQGLRRLCPGQEVRPLAVTAVLDGSSDVRNEAALTLGAFGDESVMFPIARALSSPSSTVRANAVEALGVMGYPAAVPVLATHLAALQSGSGAGSSPRAYIFVGNQRAYVQDFDVEVAQFAAIADPIINTLTEGAVLDVRVTGVNVVSTAVESSRVRRSLALLTGQEKSSRGWLAWWEEQKGDYGTESPAGARTTSGG